MVQSSDSFFFGVAEHLDFVIVYKTERSKFLINKALLSIFKKYHISISLYIRRYLNLRKR